MSNFLVCTVNVLKFEHQKRKNTLNLLSSPVKQKEVTNFAKWGNLPFAKLVTSLTYFLEIKILLYKFLEY